jgi:hypothetical protein
MHLILGLFVLSLLAPFANAQNTVCARVKIEIRQEMTLERQGFEAQMNIQNTTDSAIENIGVVVRVTDENGEPVAISDNPNDFSAKFFVRLARKENIDNVDGNGVVDAKKNATIEWLLIPAPGSAGTSPLGKKYLVGATLKYRFGSDESVMEVAPDLITVKPLPQLTLDYFLPEHVYADDALTDEIEPIVPFTLGVRVRNNGFATAKKVKIDSAQPKIVENKQGLLINFLLTGSYLDDAPAQNTLLMDFGEIPGKSNRMGRWVMETTLSGEFVEFTARFTHADELGGALTSILEATHAHFLIQDVRVDLPGRDHVRDFLARDGDVLRVYESDGTDTEVTDRSAVATFSAEGGRYRLAFPATAGFAYAKVPDPSDGRMVLGKVMRSDAKQMAPENVWLSKTRNPETKRWEYWVNFFDANTTGTYETEFELPSTEPQAPAMQFIPDRTVKEGEQMSFIIEASSAARKPLTMTAQPLPARATYVTKPGSAQAPGLVTAIFDWTPPAGSVGSYPIVFTASDGTLSTSRTATIKVVPADTAAFRGPATPAIESPLAGAALVSPTPTLRVQPSPEQGDSAEQVQFELYADEAATQLVESAMVVKAPATPGAGGALVVPPTEWKPSTTLRQGARYWWRARTFDSRLHSPWVYAHFTVESSGAAPAGFNQTSPGPDTRVADLAPVLAWTNSSTANGGAATYTVTVARDAAFTDVVAQVRGLAEAPGGRTSWKIGPPLPEAGKYYWRVVAAHPGGTQTSATPRAFTVDPSNRPPAAPVILGPSAGQVSSSRSPTLAIAPSADPENDPVRYVFEIDSVSTFDSAAKRSSGEVAATSWTQADLADDTRYWWRVKAIDGRAGSEWVTGEFVVSLSNDAPPVPRLRNPGNGAWSASPQPSLEAMLVTDPEGDAVRYEFEIYKNEGLTEKVTEGSAPVPALVVPVQLEAGKWYWWRVRARDSHDTASAWSTAASLYVGTGAAQPRPIALTSPSLATVPDTVGAGNGARKQVTIRWEGLDPSRDGQVALYFGAARSGFDGALIAEGLRQPPGAQAGSFVWDVSSLAPGVYYVYAVVYDALGQGRAYAPGSVVVPNPAQQGTLKITGPGILFEGGSGLATLSIERAAGQVFAPVSGNGIPQAPPVRYNGGPLAVQIPLIYPYQCSRAVPSFAIQAGPLISEDLDLAGRIVLGGADELHFVASNTGDETLRVCEIRVLSERKLDGNYSEFKVTGRLSNLGAGVLAARVLPIGNVPGVTSSGSLNFGTISPGESGSTPDAVTVIAPPGQAGIASILQRGLKWSVQVTR